MTLVVTPNKREDMTSDIARCY